MNEAAGASKGIATEDRRLFTRISVVPAIRDAALAERLTAELVENARAAEGGEAMARLVESKPLVRDFLAGVMECSPYLRDLALRDPVRLARVLKSDPAERMDEMCAAARVAHREATGEADLMRLLRQFKQEAALVIALADLAGAWSVDEVTRALTDTADSALTASMRFLLAEAAAGGKFTPVDADAPERGCGLIILAMGKHGAFELNYSSDIDLIVFYDFVRAPLAEGVEPSTFWIRLTKRLVKIMQERNEYGYVFRTDLRLRPDPGATAVAISLDAAIAYYESMGQNWERAALIKARPCAGDIATGDDFLQEISPFIWRKYLDYAAIADVHSIKRQIHAHKGHAAIAVAGHNIKLGRGGIREIEFFVQTQQLIAGGRTPSLRGRRTLDMLAELTERGWIAATVRDEMTEAYRFLRALEHRIQMVADEQTQTLPKDEAGLDVIARMMGFAGTEDFAEALTLRLRRVQGHYADLFEDAPALSSELGSLVFTGDDDDPATIETLSRLGFKAPQDVTRAIRGWHFGRYPATRSTRARERLTEITPALLDALAATASPDAAFMAFDRFLAGLPTGVQLFSLLHANPGLLSLLANIMGTAPRLANIVTQRSRVLDGVLDPAFYGTVPTAEELEARLSRLLGDTAFYEEALDTARAFGQEQAFLIGARILSGTISAASAGHAFATLADIIVRSLFAVVGEALAETHGRVSGGHSVLVAMGKLGGREMTASSDLDMILLYDFDEGAEASDGGRPLAPSLYYTRLTQRLVTALSAPTAAGTLYEVDFRLRPSGNAGPLATRLAAFESYQIDEAWVWEHMALTRARIIAGSPTLQARAEEIIRAVLVRPRDAEKVRADVADMRDRIEREKGTKDIWDLKNVAGGLIDVEFVAQYLQLVHAAEHPDILDTNTAAALEKASHLGLLSQGDAEILLPAGRLYHDLTQILRLCIETRFVPEEATKEFKQLLADAGTLPDFQILEAHLRDTEVAVRAAFDRIIRPTAG